MKTYKLNYYDETGKRRGKTFTARTKTLAHEKAEEWVKSNLKGNKRSSTVSQDILRYINEREPVLSPSTVRSYKGVLGIIENQPIGDIITASLTLSDVQKWVNTMVMDNLSPKTVKDRYMLLKSATKCDLDVVLPQQKRYIGHTPTDEEIKKLIEYTKGQSDKTLYRAILLTAFGPLRRSETCAITDQDINGNQITINKALVQDEDGAWVIKTTKTVGSTRVITYPQTVIEALKGVEGRIVDCNPNALVRRFERALKFAKLPHFRFHDLRVYGASSMHSLNVPDIYVMQRGGWSTDYVMRQVYFRAMSDEQQRQNEIINDHFSSL